MLGFLRQPKLRLQVSSRARKDGIRTAVARDHLVEGIALRRFEAHLADAANPPGTGADVIVAGDAGRS